MLPLLLFFVLPLDLSSLFGQPPIFFLFFEPALLSLFCLLSSLFLDLFIPKMMTKWDGRPKAQTAESKVDWMSVPVVSNNPCTFPDHGAAVEWAVHWKGYPGLAQTVEESKNLQALQGQKRFGWIACKGLLFLASKRFDDSIHNQFFFYIFIFQ